MYVNSAVFPKLNAYLYHIFFVVNKTKEFKNGFTQFKKIYIHIAYGSTYWYSIENRIGSVWLKCIGNVWLIQCIGNYWLCMVKAY